MDIAQIKLISRAIAHQCIRNNTDLEDLHGLSKISDEEIRSLMLGIEKNLINMLDFLFEVVEKGKVNINGRDFTIKDILEQFKKTYKKGVSWDKKGYGGF